MSHRMFPVYGQTKRALPVNFSSIAIKLNIPRDEFSSIKLTFVTLRRGFKKASSVFFDIDDSWDKFFFLIRLHQSIFACLR